MAYTFLIVDDSSIVRKAFGKAVKLSGLDVGTIYEAENGKRALAVLRSQAVDLVLLDINMPEMSGIEFMHVVRSEPALKDTRVVVISTEGSRARKEELARLAVIDYLRKPITPEALTDSVTRLLGGNHGRL